MVVKSAQFSVATHVMGFLAFNDGKEISSSTVAESMNAGRQRIVMGKLLRLLVSQAMGICSLLGHSSTFGKREDLV